MDNKRHRNRKTRGNKANKETKLAILIIITSGIIIYLLLNFISSRLKISKLNNESNELKIKTEQLSNEIKTLKDELEVVNSLEYIEKKAREELGMIKNGEQIFVPEGQLDQGESEEEKNTDENESETSENTNSQSQ